MAADGDRSLIYLSYRNASLADHYFAYVTASNYTGGSMSTIYTEPEGRFICDIKCVPGEGVLIGTAVSVVLYNPDSGETTLLAIDTVSSLSCRLEYNTETRDVYWLRREKLIWKIPIDTAEPMNSTTGFFRSYFGWSSGAFYDIMWSSADPMRLYMSGTLSSSYISPTLKYTSLSTAYSGDQSDVFPRRMTHRTMRMQSIAGSGSSLFMSLFVLHFSLFVLRACLDFSLH